MLKKISLISFFILAITMFCMAADLITGVWVGTVSTGNGDIAVSYNLKTEGEKLTGTLSTVDGDFPVNEGKVSGNDISFKITYGDLVVPHSGKLSGDTLKMKIQIQDEVVQSNFFKKK